TPENQKHFPQPKGQRKGCGFPVPKVLGLFDAVTGLVITVLFTPLYCHEVRSMPTLHKALEAGSLLVGDRAFCAYVHFALLNVQKTFGLFRIHASRINSFQKKTPRRRSQARKARKARKASRPLAAGRLKVIQRFSASDRLVLWTRPRPCYCP